MKDVKKCSLSGVGFTFEIEAYEALSNYLNELHEQYKEDPDGEEIIADIEARIAELILSTQDNGHTVALPLVQNIIAQMGSAAQIDERPGHEPRQNAPQAPRIPRRLYRDAEQAKLGGVCAGLGNYFDIDPVWVRLALFAPIFLSVVSNLPYLNWLHSLMGNLFGIFVLGYLIMWFAVPTARSARQKLEMKGERITAETIREQTSSSRSNVDGRPKAMVANTVSTFGQLLTIVLKLFAGVILLGVVLAACGLTVALCTVLFTPEGGSILLPHGALEIGRAVPAFGILTVLIPCLLLTYVLLCLIASRRPGGKAVGFTFLGWVVIIFLLMFTAIRQGVHHELRNEMHPTPTYNGRNLLNDEPTSESTDQTTDPQPIVSADTPEEEVSISLDEKSGLKIKVVEKE